MDVPDHMQPKPGQIPSFVETQADLERWEASFAIAVAICGRADPAFITELYSGDIPTH